MSIRASILSSTSIESCLDFGLGFVNGQAFLGRWILKTICQHPLVPLG